MKRFLRLMLFLLAVELLLAFALGVRMRQQIEREKGPLPANVLQQVRKEALDGLINEKLIAAVAVRLDVVASDEQIDNAIESIANDAGVTVVEIYGAAASQGLDRAHYRKELGGQITRMRVVSGSVRSRVSVSDAEVQELYEKRYGRAEPGTRIETRHILLPWPESESPEARAAVRQRAQEIYELAQSGTDFGGLARQHSVLRSRAQGGLTLLREGEVSPEIAKHVLTAEPGTITEPIETEHGMNLFQVLDRFDPSEQTFEKVQDTLYAELMESKTIPEFERWLGELRETRYVGILLPELR